MLDWKRIKYVISIPNLDYRPKDKKNEVVFLGRSNVGKSTLINTLTAQKIAFSSKKAGKTKYLNYFLLDETYYLVDAPGYGYTAYGSKEDKNFAEMMENYFQNDFLKCAVMLLDTRRTPNQDDNLMISFLKEENIPFIIVFTKADQANQSEKYKAKTLGATLGAKEVFFSSPKERPDEIRKAIAAYLESKKDGR